MMSEFQPVPCDATCVTIALAPVVRPKTGRRRLSGLLMCLTAMIYRCTVLKAARKATRKTITSARLFDKWCPKRTVESATLKSA